MRRKIGFLALRLFLACVVLLVPACSKRRPGPVLPSYNPVPPPPIEDVLMWHNDMAHTGQYLTETILTPAKVNTATFGKLFTQPVDGQVFAQPLYKSQVAIPGLGTHNVVYVATMHDSLYAFDADTNAGADVAPLWHQSFINPPSVTSVPLSDYPGYTDILNEIGILSTPVIDPVSSTLYVIVKTKETAAVTGTNNLGHVYRLHALDLGTGQEKFGGPVVLGGSVPGTGDASVSGTITFDPILQNNRSALLLVGGVVYVAFSSYGDVGLYHGWVLAYDAKTLAQAAIWNDTPNNPPGNPGQGGIWMNSSSPLSDGTSIFLSTGNGWFDTTPPVSNYSDSMVKLLMQGGAPGIGTYLSVLDYFTPANQATLTTNDWDLDAGGLLLLPDQPGPVPHLLLGAGKDGSVFLVNRDNMSRFNAGGDLVVQESLNQFLGMFSTPAYWNGQVFWKGSTRDISDQTVSPFVTFALVPGSGSTPTKLNFAPTSSSTATWGWPGSTPSISANGTTGGIVWVIQAPFKIISGSPVSTAAILRAFDATNLASELYNSTLVPADGMGKAVKFTLPTVAHGKVYVGSGAVTPTPANPSELSVFGLK
jgi:hypothetical protein